MLRLACTPPHTKACPLARVNVCVRQEPQRRRAARQSRKGVCVCARSCGRAYTPCCDVQSCSRTHIVGVRQYRRSAHQLNIESASVQVSPLPRNPKVDSNCADQFFDFKTSELRKLTDALARMLSDPLSAADHVVRSQLGATDCARMDLRDDIRACVLATAPSPPPPFSGATEMSRRDRTTVAATQR
jgi:hypothetical protein